jgi:hypothetical protein
MNSSMFYNSLNENADSEKMTWKLDLFTLGMTDVFDTRSRRCEDDFGDLR